MAYARHRNWHRAGPVVATSALLFGLTTWGCDGGETTTGATDNSGGGTTTTTTNAGGDGGGGTTNTGGSGGTTTTPTGGGGTGGMSEPESHVAATDIGSPFDAAPNPDNTLIYFTASDPAKGAGVFRVSAMGGTSTTLFAGDPFVAPFGIAVATSGQELYVADPASVTDMTDAGDSGQIFVVANDGGAPTSLSGSGGLRPRSLDTRDVEGSDVIYFTGEDKNGPNLFTIPAAGGAAEAVVTGGGLVEPSGVAVSTDGDAYIVDTADIGSGISSVKLVKGGETSADVFVAGIHVGYPAGIALTLDDATLLVSGLDPATGKDVIIQISVADKAQTLFTGDADTNLSLFEEIAGMHRAKLKNSFGLVDSRAKNTAGQTTFGVVFSINL